MITKFSKSFGFALTGLKIAWREELNFKIELACALLAIIAGILLHISLTEFAIIALTIGFVLAVEGLNTALEELCDKFQPTHDPHIAKIKDLAAAAVLISSVGALAVATFIFGPYIITLDHALETWLAAGRTLPWLQFFYRVTEFGNWQVITTFSIITAFVLAGTKKWQAFKGFVVAMLGTGVTIEILKLIIARPRPEIIMPYITESTYAFPSGHAAGSLAFYCFVVWLACQYLPKGPSRKLIAYLALIIILAVGTSRMYLGVHWFSDVLAGYTVGLVWLLVGIKIAKRSAT